MDGTIVQFSCTVIAEEIDVLVNDTATNEQNIVQAGFIELQDILNATTRRLNVTATALSQYNNTEVYCRGVNIVDHMPFTALSEVATLLVQGKFIITFSTIIMTCIAYILTGLLSSVSVISHDFINSSSLNISWNPPFTLPGTHITGYNISLTSIMFNISQFITDTYLVLTAPNNTDPCDEISITVSGYNGAGNGEMTTISSLYFPSGDNNLMFKFLQYITCCYN